jgi:hypothetical protein
LGLCQMATRIPARASNTPRVLAAGPPPMMATLRFELGKRRAIREPESFPAGNNAGREPIFKPAK